MQKTESRSRIRVLDDKTINQVAAGEVIESTASVVKELVENSLDAGATEIHVEIISGGRNLIRITDNGIGMSSDDALLAFERHATSKIRNLQDLSIVGTMGFRGEALPSIASVAKCSLKTCYHGEATAITIHGGKILSHESCAHVQGTEIEVRSLFYNVPVRRNFQKSVGWDTQNILHVLCQESLASPNCSFRLTADGKELLRTAVQYQGPSEEKVKARIGEVLNVPFLKKAHYVQSQEGCYTLWGVISDPLDTRPNRRGQYLFINNRAVESPFISKILKIAFGTRIPQHRYPSFVLWLELPMEHVDVNVHPQKKEVRLRDEEKLDPFLMKTIREALHKPFGGQGAVPETKRLSQGLPKLHNVAPLLQVKPAISQQQYHSQELFQEKEVEARPLEVCDISVLAQVGTYALVYSSYIASKLNEVSSLHLVHLGRLEQRLYYDAYKNSRQKREYQKLAFPITISFSKSEICQVLPLRSVVHNMGIVFRELEADSIIIEEVDVRYISCANKEWLTNFFYEVLSQAEKGIHSFEEEPWLHRAASLIQYQSKKTNHATIRLLVEKVLACSEWMRAPSGKVIFVSLSEDKITRRLFE